MGTFTQSTPYSTELGRKQINFYYTNHIKEINSEVKLYYVIYGTIFDIKLNTTFEYSKEFSNFHDAEQYMRDIIKEYPYSTAILKEKSTRTLKSYN